MITKELADMINKYGQCKCPCCNKLVVNTLGYICPKCYWESDFNDDKLFLYSSANHSRLITYKIKYYFHKIIGR